MEQHNERCETCGARLQAYWHRLTPGLLSALVKMRAGIAISRVNQINPSTDLDGTPNEMTKNERSNLTKLRYHALIAKVHEGDERMQGEWLITRRGFAFLRGDQTVPARVKTYRNKVTDHDTRLVSIADVLGTTPYFERIQDIEYDAPTGQGSLL